MSDSASPKISVVMCVQNGLPELPDSVQSILSQSFKDFEFIIIDDRSSDQTLPYLKSLTDPRIIIEQNKGTGQTAGLNQGLKRTRAEWIARMDGDDWSFPQRFQRQWDAALKNKDAVLISADYVVCDESLSEVAPIELSSRTENLISYLRKKNNPFCHPVMMFRRQTALAVGGFDEQLKNAQDYRLWLELLKRGRLVHVPELLLKYRVRRGSLSILRQPEQTRERQQIISEGAPPTAQGSTQLASPQKVEGMYEYRLAFAAWCAGRRISCQKHALRALRRRTRPLRALALIFSALLPASWYLRWTGYSRVYRPKSIFQAST